MTTASADRPTLPEFDPFDPAFQADPYPVLALARERAPVFYFEPLNFWVLTRYKDVAGMIGEVGRTLTAIGPERPGRVATHGEIWQAASEDSIPEGARVRVTRVDGLRLVVRKD